MKTKQTILFMGSDQKFQELLVKYKEGSLSVGQARAEKGVVKSHLKIKGSEEDILFGQVFASPEFSRKATLYVTEDEKSSFEQVVKENTKERVITSYIKHKNSELAIFSSFVEQMKVFESALKNKVGGPEAPEEIIPEEFYVLLEFEFFRQVIQSSESFSFGYGAVKSFEGKNTLLTSIVVTPLKEKDGDLVFFGVVEY